MTGDQIISKDQSPFGPTKIVKMNRVRKVSAKHLYEAHTKTVPVTHMDDADAEILYNVRKEIFPIAEKEGVKLTYLPYLMKAAVHSLQFEPGFNATLDEKLLEDNHYRINDYYNVGYAVDTPNGLIVLNVKNADSKSLLEIAAEIEEKSAYLRETGKVSDMDDLQGGTFTLTNIGAIGGRYSNPIINYPESAILAIGRMRKEPIVRDDKIVPGIILPLSLRFDHRIVDGADAARFMNYFMDFLSSRDELIKL